jgi:hypothetical protein
MAIEDKIILIMAGFNETGLSYWSLISTMPVLNYDALG